MEQIGRYEIAAELGRGAMGVVYRARDPRIGREVAIKTIKPADQADADETEGLRERLFREAQSAGRLSHPGIVTIFDVDEQDGLVYIAMELVEGQTLDRHAAAAGGGAQSLDFAIDLLLQVGAALDYAHRRGIVHRDIKPSNIMISPDGVKIMDFGVARIASSQLTRTGAVVGTPNYMSPEQVKGEEIDGRSDQFSLGAVAYELLTGKKPFQSSSLTSTIFRIVSADPALPRQLNPKIPLPLEKAVLRALTKDPDGRFATCREFAETVAEQSRARGENIALSAAFADSAGGGETMAADPAQQEATRADVRLAGAPAEGTSAAAGAGQDAPAGKAGERGQPNPAEASPILPESVRKAHGSEPAPKQAAVLPPRRFEPERRSRWPLAVFLLLLAATGGLSLFLYNNPNLLDDPGRLLRVVLGLEPQAESGVPRAAADGQEAPAAPAVEPQVAPSGSGAEAEPPVPVPATSPKPLPGKELKSAGRGGPAAVEAGSDPAEAASAPAVSALDAAGAGAPAAEEPAIEESAAAEKAAAAAGPAPVTFRSNMRGARIAIDRRAEWTCTAPCAPMNLPAGRHTARVTLNGYRPQQKSFDVGPKPLEIAFALQPLRAILVITSSPPGAGIHIDGRDTGRRTPARIAVAPGRRNVRVVKGGLSVERTIEAAAESLQPLSFTLGNR